jgi:hypothetical protein
MESLLVNSLARSRTQGTMYVLHHDLGIQRPDIAITGLDEIATSPPIVSDPGPQNNSQARYETTARTRASATRSTRPLNNRRRSIDT